MKYIFVEDLGARKMDLSTPCLNDDYCIKNEHKKLTIYGQFLVFIFYAIVIIQTRGGKVHFSCPQIFNKYVLHELCV